MTDKLLSDEEILIRLDELVMKCEGTQWIPEHNSYLNDMLNLINTQKRLYAESLIGDDGATAECSYLPPTLDEMTKSAHEKAVRNQLRAEQRARIR